MTLVAEGTALEVEIPEGRLEGTLAVPRDAVGVVAFAHGSGSSRHSPRNRAVAEALGRAGLGTYLVDLLTPAEGALDEIDARYRFDIPLLGHRVVAVVDTLERMVTQPIGLFGASTGAAAALIGAAERPDAVGAVVSRGGRPDLAADALGRVRAATLFIVGGADHEVLQLNRAALAAMRAPVRELAVVPGATHLFEEPGALERVSDLAAAWFARHLTVQR